MKKNYTLTIRNKAPYKLNHLKGFKVKYLGATNTMGSRVKITDLRLNESVTLSYNYSLNSIKEMAVDYLVKERNITVDSFLCLNDDEYVLMTTDFESTLKGSFKSIEQLENSVTDEA